jgi:hypothetical protein
MSKRRLYAAYGSNLNLSQMAARCPTARPLGTAAIEGYELLFRGGRYGAMATVEPKEGAAAPVLLWELKPGDEAALDRYEGFPQLYGKRNVDVELNGKPVTAMAYVMTPGHGTGTPSEHYLAAIAEGYRTSGFDPAVLAAAVKRSAALMEREFAEWEQVMEPAPEDGWPGPLGMKWR